MRTKLYTKIGPCRKAVLEMRGFGTVGLVPTMGALHAGHLALIAAARQRCRYTAVTIFVNPLQFAAGEDFEAYPRPLETDLEACRRANVDLVFTPSVQDMFGVGSLTTVHVADLSEGLCGPFRPGHFDGVATVVTKLFNILPADCAIFGEKDYQQLVLIQRLVRDLSLPIEIIAHPTVRESDGLAMSSRNAYLDAAQRRQATSLSRGLFSAQRQAREGERRSAILADAVRREILNAGPVEIEYIEVVDALSLERLQTVDRPARICLALRIGNCRLIDNVPVDASPVRA